MSSVASLDVLSDLRKIFGSGVNSVRPETIFSKNQCLKINKTTLKVAVSDKDVDEFNISEKKIHIIGFGKALLGLTIEVENVLKERLASGIISVPIGSATVLQNSKSSVIKIIEGAKDNLPDENAFKASQLILEKCKSLTENDVLLCLISGGGSALLPYPSPPITLADKTRIIKALSRKGATINELNTVRIAMSQVKGGKLALAAKNASQIISLIISDIIDDPLDLIASGPTVPTKSDNKSALKILEEYDLKSTISNEILSTIEKNIPTQTLTNVKNYIIANNEKAIKASMKEAQKLGYETIFLSKSVMGDVKDVCQIFEELTNFALKKINNLQLSTRDNPNLFQQLSNSLKSCIDKNSKGVCVISGGEPTVKVTGSGLGGRNQELALRFANFCSTNCINNVFLLSAGTDGIDGPGNDAAGAIGANFSSLKYDTENAVDYIEEYLNNNDSYNFYKKFAKDYHIITGHTGTNVMDLQILLINNL
uniref:Glycerate kinase n=1 Tax=Culicoides sonorensis TaxID=179676 RepID=A0A336LWM4_CULSO